MYIFVRDFDVFLTFKRDSLKPQFIAHRQFVDFLHKAGTYLPMDLDRGSDHSISQVFLLRRQWTFNSQSGHLLTSFLRSSFLRGSNFFGSFLRALRFFVVAISSALFFASFVSSW